MNRNQRALARIIGGDHSEPQPRGENDADHLTILLNEALDEIREGDIKSAEISVCGALGIRRLERKSKIPPKEQ